MSLSPQDKPTGGPSPLKEEACWPPLPLTGQHCQQASTQALAWLGRQGQAGRGTGSSVLCLSPGVPVHTLRDVGAAALVAGCSLPGAELPRLTPRAGRRPRPALAFPTLHWPRHRVCFLMALPRPGPWAACIGQLLWAGSPSPPEPGAPAPLRASGGLRAGQAAREGMMGALGTALSPCQAFRTQGAFPQVSSRPPWQSTSGGRHPHALGPLSASPPRTPWESS